MAKNAVEWTRKKGLHHLHRTNAVHGLEEFRVPTSRQALSWRLEGGPWDVAWWWVRVDRRGMFANEAMLKVLFTHGFPIDWLNIQTYIWFIKYLKYAQPFCQLRKGASTTNIGLAMAQPSTTDKKKSGNFPIVQAGCDPSSSLASFTLTRCSSWIIQI